jgi:hypothetical protein
MNAGALNVLMPKIERESCLSCRLPEGSTRRLTQVKLWKPNNKLTIGQALKEKFMNDFQGTILDHLTLFHLNVTMYAQENIISAG